MQVAGLKLPVAGLTTLKVTTPPVGRPNAPLSPAVTATPAIDPYCDVTAVTLDTVGAALLTARLKVAAAVAPLASVTVTVYTMGELVAVGVPVIEPVEVE